MFSCRLMSGDVGVNYVSSDIDLFLKFQGFLKDSFILLMKIFRDIDSSMPTINYSNNPSGNFTDWQVALGVGGGIVDFPWNQMNEGETLLYLSSPYIEWQLNKRKRFSIHAASVRMDNGSGVVLLGKEGSGKSLTALTLCQKYGARLIGNDVCVIGFEEGRLLSCYGTNFFFFRRESLARNRPDLLSMFKDPSTGDTWLQKLKIPSANLKVVMCPFRDTEVKSVYVVHVDETKDQLVVTDLSGHLATILFLNENFSRYIRSTCTTMLNGRRQPIGYVPSFDSPDFYLERRDVICHILNNLGLVHVTGPLGMVVDYILSKS